jgi:1-deoxy-D-xylulose-5-phosphate synthase
MMEGTGLKEFSLRFPERFFDVGIAEGHAVAMAAGLASMGLIPVFAVYSTFLQRSYDMLLHDVGIQGLHVVLCVDRAGLVPGDGETHQGSFDVAFLASVPGMTVLCPASFGELRGMLRYAALELGGPVAIRYPRGGEGEYRGGGYAPYTTVRPGTDITIVTYGTMVNIAVRAARILDGEGISAEIVKLGRINPLDCTRVAESARRTGKLLVLEDSSRAGCVGERVSSSLAVSGDAPGCIILMNLGDGYLPCGSLQELLELRGIDAASVADAARAAVTAGGAATQPREGPR